MMLQYVLELYCLLQFLSNAKKKLLKWSSKTQLFVEIICLPCCSMAPVQQQRDIPEENVPCAPPPDD